MILQAVRRVLWKKIVLKVHPNANYVYTKIKEKRKL